MEINYAGLVHLLKQGKYKSISLPFDIEIPTLIINLIWLKNCNFVAVALSATLNEKEIEVPSFIVDVVSIRCNMRWFKAKAEDLLKIKSQAVFFVGKDEVERLIESIKHPDVLHHFHWAGLRHTCIIVQVKKEVRKVCLEINKEY